MQNLDTNQSSRSRNESRQRPLYKAFNLLPEARKQRTVRQDALKFVLRKWKKNQEREIPIISKRLQFWLFLSDWWWLMSAIFLISGLAAINYANPWHKQSEKITDCVKENQCIVLLQSASVDDFFSPDFDTGELTVKFTANGTSDDYLGIRNQGDGEDEIRTKDNNVSYGGKIIGSFEGGKETEPLLVKFNTSATREAAQALVRNIVYQSVSRNPKIGSRQVEFKITDGDGGISKPFTIKIQDKDSILNVPSSQTVKENANLSISGISLLSADNLTLTITLKATNGTLNIKPNVAKGLTAKDISNNQSTQVTLTGTVKQINSTLADSGGLIYRRNKNFSGEDMLTATVSDGEKIVLWPPSNSEDVNSNLDSKSISITVVPTNPPPIITVPSKQFTNQNTDLPISGMTLSDPNNPNLTVTLEVTNGILTVKTDIPNGLTANDIENNKTKKITLKGDTTKINKTLANAAGIIYRGRQNYAGSDNLIITASDGSKTDRETIGITVNDNPVISIAKVPEDVSSVPSGSSNATIVGEPGQKNIRRGPGLEYPTRHIAYPGDRVQVIKSVRNSDNFIWYHIYFPQSGADGWIAGNLLAVDGQTTYPSQPQIQPPSQPPPKASSRGTNATVSGTPGTKNIRSGAGTAYGVVGTVRTGDRLQILGSSYDRGGYQWYKVYHPQSGTTGWIAAQLIIPD